MFFRVKGSGVNPDLWQESSFTAYGVGRISSDLRGFETPGISDGPRSSSGFGLRLRCVDRSAEGTSGDSALEPEPGREALPPALPRQRTKAGLKTVACSLCSARYCFPRSCVLSVTLLSPLSFLLLCLSIIKTVPGESLLVSDFITFFKFKFSFCLRVWTMKKTVTPSGGRQRDSAVHTRESVLPQAPPSRAAT